MISSALSCGKKLEDATIEKRLGVDILVDKLRG
jgi:hypothetical protein